MGQENQPVILSLVFVEGSMLWGLSPQNPFSHSPHRIRQGHKTHDDQNTNIFVGYQLSHDGILRS